MDLVGEYPVTREGRRQGLDEAPGCLGLAVGGSHLCSEYATFSQFSLADFLEMFYSV